MYAKRLSANDDNKNQPYFGTKADGLKVLNFIPVRGIRTHRNTAGTPSFVADMDFSWLGPDGAVYPAPRTKLILYPQYPEVRFSGFLDGSAVPYADLMKYDRTSSLPPRILFVGVTENNHVFGFVTLASSAIGQQFNTLTGLPQTGVLYETALGAPNQDRIDLCRELRRIHELGWINSCTLKRDDQGIWRRVPCRHRRCG